MAIAVYLQILKQTKKMMTNKSTSSEYTETERKFLILSMDFIPFACKHSYITQGYICDDHARTVRVRLRDDRGFLTIKGASDSSGTTRFEWEKAIRREEAEKLLNICLPGRIEKTRYLVENNSLTFEVDVFEGENKGLVMAEIELEYPDQSFEKPAWLGREVTGDPRYYNAMLMKKPFSRW